MTLVDLMVDFKAALMDPLTKAPRAIAQSLTQTCPALLAQEHG